MILSRGVIALRRYRDITQGTRLAPNIYLPITANMWLRSIRPWMTERHVAALRGCIRDARDVYRAEIPIAAAYEHAVQGSHRYSGDLSDAYVACDDLLATLDGGDTERFNAIVYTLRTKTNRAHAASACRRQ